MYIRMTLGQLKRIIREAVARPNRPLTDLEAADYRRKDLEDWLANHPEGRAKADEIEAYYDKIRNQKKEYWSNKDTVTDDDLEVDGAFIHSVGDERVKKDPLATSSWHHRSYGYVDVWVKGWIQNSSFTAKSRLTGVAADEHNLVLSTVQIIQEKFAKSDLVKYMAQSDLVEKVKSDIKKNSPTIYREMTVVLNGGNDFSTHWEPIEQRNKQMSSIANRVDGQDRKPKNPEKFPEIVKSFDQLMKDGRIGMSSHSPSDMGEIGEKFKKDWSDLSPRRKEREEKDRSFEDEMSRRRSSRQSASIEREKQKKDAEMAAAAAKREKEFKENPLFIKALSSLKEFLTKPLKIIPRETEVIDVEQISKFSFRSLFRTKFEYDGRVHDLEFYASTTSENGYPQNLGQKNEFSKGVMLALIEKTYGSEVATMIRNQGFSFAKEDFLRGIEKVRNAHRWGYES